MVVVLQGSCVILNCLSLQTAGNFRPELRDLEGEKSNEAKQVMEDAKRDGGREKMNWHK